MINKQKKQAKQLLKKFGSSLTAEEIEVTVLHDCECDTCGANFLDTFMDYPAVDIENDSVLCEDCELDKIHENDVECDFCEEMFEDPQTPEENRFAIYPRMESSAGIEMGVYQVLSFPFLYSDMFSMSIFGRSVQRIGDIPSEQHDRERSNPICPECFARYSSITTKKIFNINGKKMRVLQLPLGKNKTVWY